jgi:cytoskeletal protein CcmA (bactofilin family)
MLRREKKSENGNLSFAEGSISDSKPAPPVSPAPSPYVKDEKTVIGEHIFIEGSIRGEEHLLIEGSMKGNIDMPKHNFHMGSKGRFEGEIQALNVNIGGQMIGKIKSQGRVEITKDADFLGDIKAKSISLEDGAYFKGSIELDREPHRKPAAAGKTIEPPVSRLEPKPIPPGDKLNKVS